MLIKVLEVQWQAEARLNLWYSSAQHYVVVKEIMSERGFEVDHSTIYNHSTLNRWVLDYIP